MKRNRVCIYAKDVSLLTGCTLRSGQKQLQNLRFILNKEKHQYITIQEFAKYSGIDIELIREICSGL